MVALLPFLVTFLPQIYFDVDPSSPGADAPVTSFGPAGSQWYCVAAASLAALTLGLCAWLKRPIAWWVVALVAVGVGVQLLHFMPARPDNLWYGSAWIAGSLLGLSAYHLCQLPGARRWVIAGFIAILVPVTLDSAFYVFVEHPQTVAMYERGEFVSSAAQQHAESYERRLKAPDAVGAFSLSNVLGSLTAVSTLIAAAVVLAATRRSAKITAGVCTAAGLFSIYLTHSKGAIVGLLVGALILLLTPMLQRFRTLAVVVCVGCVVAAVAGIIAVASMGTPDHGEGGARVSLLFRYHYWQGAAAQIAEHPLLGNGQEGFREDYLRTKNPLSPEDVRSSHNVFVDWIAMLGVGGWAWAALAMTWLVMLARSGPAPSQTPDADGAVKVTWVPCALVTAALFACMYVVQFDLFGVFATTETREVVIDWSGISNLALWLVSLAGFLAVLVVVVRSELSARWAWGGMLASATALLSHNQIEMTFHHMPSVVPAWVLLGAAASAGARETKSRRIDAMALLVPGAAALAIVLMAATPVTNQQRHLALAAQALRAGWGEVGLFELEAAAQPIPADPATLRWRILTRLQYADVMERNGRPRDAAAARASALSLCSPEKYSGVSSYRLDRWRSQVHEAMGDIDAAIADQRRTIERVPYSVNDRLRLGMLLEGAGQVDDAVETYRELLEVDAMRRLDPTTQLKDDERAHVEAYLQQHGG